MNEAEFQRHLGGFASCVDNPRPYKEMHKEKKEIIGIQQKELHWNSVDRSNVAHANQRKIKDRHL